MEPRNAVFVLLSFIVALLLLPASVNAQVCDPTTTVHLQVKAYDKVTPPQESFHQMPAFKEGALLNLGNLTITNHGNCTIPPSQFKIHFAYETDDRNIQSCLDWYIPVDRIPPNGVYSTQDSQCYVRLTAPGRWNVTPSWKPFSESPTEYRIDVLYIEGGLPNNGKFTVLDTATALQIESNSKTIELASQNIVMGWVSIAAMLLIGFSTMALSIRIFKEERKRQEDDEKRKQEDILKSIRTVIKVVRENADGQIKELKKRPPRIPSYFISNIPADFYLTNIRDSLPNGNDAWTLKEALIKAQHKIENINRLVELGQNQIVSEHNPTKAIEELTKKDFTYHTDLKKLLKIVKDQLYSTNIY